MKKYLLSMLLLVVATTMSAQSLILGDANQDGQLNISDVTKTVNMILGKEDKQRIDLSPYRVDNSMVVGTWYMPDRTSFAFNADGTTTYPGGKTFKFMPSQGHLIIYDATGQPVKAISLWEITSEYLLAVDYATGAFTRYTDTEPFIPDYVDLGLPSGTLWATCNVGASKPEEYGDYFAWGETTGYRGGKTTFAWATYKYCNGSETTMTKYCTDSSYGTVDNMTELELSDDAAYVNWGADWRMPSHEQINELINSNYTTAELITQNGVYGRKITSKKNGNSIFLPTAGVRDDTSISNEGAVGYYWSRMLNTDEPCNGRFLNIASNSTSPKCNNRYYGRSVRPVRASK